MTRFKVGDLVELSAAGRKVLTLGKAHGAFGMILEVSDSIRWDWEARDWIVHKEANLATIQWFGLRNDNPLCNSWRANRADLNSTKINLRNLKRLKQKK